jgi:hypothetical protein
MKARLRELQEYMAGMVPFPLLYVDVIEKSTWAFSAGHLEVGGGLTCYAGFVSVPRKR